MGRLSRFIMICAGTKVRYDVIGGMYLLIVEGVLGILFDLCVNDDGGLRRRRRTSQSICSVGDISPQSVGSRV